MTTALISIATSGNNTIIPARGQNRILIKRIEYLANGVVTISLKSVAPNGVETLLLPGQAFSTGQGVIRDQSADPWFVTNPGDAFVINLSSGVQVSGFCQYD